RASLGGEAAMPGNLCKLLAGQHKQSRDEHGFGNLAVLIGCGLEGLPRRIGEAVQVQAIVPIGAPNEWQSMRSKTLQRVTEAALQMLVERRLGAGRIVIGYPLIQDAPIAGLLQIGGDADNQ